MKKIFSFILAVLLIASGLAFPVFAEDAFEYVTLTEDMLTVEGATVEYDSYLSSYKITPVTAGEQVTVTIKDFPSTIAVWLPATAADQTLTTVFESASYIADVNLTAEHKFGVHSMGFDKEDVWITYTPSDVYSIYIFDKMAGLEYQDEIGALANGTLYRYDEEYLDLDYYDVERYTKYYWENDIIFNESFMVIAEEDGTIAPEKTLYEIDRVVSVRNSYLNKEYVYGTDYLIEDGKLVIPEGSAISAYAHSSVYRDVQPNSGWWKTLDGTYVYAGQYDMYFVGYLNITYTTKDTWDGAIPESKGILLSNFHSKLNDGNTVKVLAIGDSLAGGANVSSDIGWEGVAPYAERWSDMTASALRLLYPYVTIENETIAQGGATASLAIEKK